MPLSSAKIMPTRWCVQSSVPSNFTVEQASDERPLKTMPEINTARQKSVTIVSSPGRKARSTKFSHAICPHTRRPITEPALMPF